MVAVFLKIERILIPVTIAVVLADTAITSILPFTVGLSSSLTAIAIFSFTTLAYALGSSALLRFVASKVKPGEQKIIGLLHRVVRFSQFILISLLALIILQMLLTTSYNINFLKSILSISYILSSVILGVLSYRFISWSSFRPGVLVVSFGLATAALSFTAAITVAYVANELTGQLGLEYVTPLSSPVSITVGGPNILSSAYLVSSSISFILTWFAAALLLRYYARKLGRIKYWVIMALPLIWFLSQFPPTIADLMAPFRIADPILFGIVYSLLISIVKISGGIMLGLAFWRISTTIDDDLVKNFMIASAYGVLILFAANQPIGLTLAPYPPFGLAAVSLVGLGSYLLYVGILSSAISISEDTKLRQSIRKIAKESSSFLDVIGTAAMEKEIERKVITMISESKQRMDAEASIGTSLNQEDAKQYLQEVLNEIKKEKSDKKTDYK